MTELQMLAIAIVIMGGVGAAIGSVKGRPVGGLILGLVLGPIGWLLVGIGKNYSEE